MTNRPENTVKKQDGRFKKGQSGNPAGKPKGARHKTTLAALALLEGEAETLTRKAVELALAGDTTALKLCLERIAPAIKPTTKTITLDLPEDANFSDMARHLIQAAGRGMIPPDIAAQLVSAATGAARLEELEVVKQRLESLEVAFLGGD